MVGPAEATPYRSVRHSMKPAESWRAPALRAPVLPTPSETKRWILRSARVPASESARLGSHSSRRATLQRSEAHPTRKAQQTSQHDWADPLDDTARKHPYHDRMREHHRRNVSRELVEGTKAHLELRMRLHIVRLRLAVFGKRGLRRPMLPGMLLRQIPPYHLHLAFVPLLLGCAARHPTGAPPAEPNPAEPTTATPSPASFRPTAGSESKIDAREGMVRIDGATLTLGTTEFGAELEDPFQVTVETYEIDRREVTVGAYAACVDAGGCAEPVNHAPEHTLALWRARWEFSQQGCNWPLRSERGDHPMNCVNYGEAERYCAWAGKRLPTEAEWELAARGHDDRLYPWGAQPPTAQHANGCGPECVARAEASGQPGWQVLFQAEDGWATTAPVGSYTKGRTPGTEIDDLAGNVAEWTSGQPCKYDGSKCRDKQEGVSRGWGWDAERPDQLRTTYRMFTAKQYGNDTRGFRCAASAGS